MGQLTTDDTRERAEEEILAQTVSDEILEAAAGTESGVNRITLRNHGCRHREPFVRINQPPAALSPYSG
jgi:hypothetical protein